MSLLIVNIERRKPKIELPNCREKVKRIFRHGKVKMVSNFPPQKPSAKMDRQNSLARVFGQNSLFPPKDPAWCKTPLSVSVCYLANTH